MSNSKKVDIVLMIMGFIIMSILQYCLITESHAADDVSGVAPTIFGATLFISGYIGLKIDK